NKAARRLLNIRPYFALSGTRTTQFCLQTKLLFKQAIELLMENEKLAAAARQQVDVDSWGSLEAQFEAAVEAIKQESDNPEDLAVFLCRFDAQ
ncbi:MAG: hypothetical protein V2I33_25065, partial [Kangiellaceae bacterium]|nr:hypothetical protein [Kangiellaceae bacterium]